MATLVQDDGRLLGSRRREVAQDALLPSPKTRETLGREVERAQARRAPRARESRAAPAGPPALPERVPARPGSRPTAVRRRVSRCATVPRARPMSAARTRTYVPFEQSTAKAMRSGSQQLELEPPDLDLPRFALHLDATARQRVERRPVPLQRRVHRRRLALAPEKRGRDRCQPARDAVGNGSRRDLARRYGPACRSRRPAGSTPVYALSSSRRWRATLVASPRQSGSSPLANGSSVPRCPTFVPPQQRLEHPDDARRRDTLRLVDQEEPGHSPRPRRFVCCARPAARPGDGPCRASCRTRSGAPGSPACRAPARARRAETASPGAARPAPRAARPRRSACGSRRARAAGRASPGRP